MKTLKFCIVSMMLLAATVFVSCQHEPELVPGTAEVFFQKDVMLIINSNCNVAGCHGTGGELPDLNTYENVSRFVTAGKPMKSELHEVLVANPDSEKYMPPKPKSALTKTQIDMISIWILQGAKNN